MKLITHKLSIAMMLLVGTFLWSCQTSSEKVDAAKENVAEAKEDLREVQQDAATDAVKVATAEEWQQFKDESNELIRKNEIRIEEIKVKMNKKGKTLDAVYAKNIETLEQKNKDLKTRIGAYENNQGNWESFKREFNHDMDELGKALTDLTVNNKN